MNKRNFAILLTIALLFVVGTYMQATIYNAPLTVSGLFTASGHTVLEGVTSTGATGSGKLVYDTGPIIDLTNAINIPAAATAALKANIQSGSYILCTDAAGSSTTYTCTATPTLTAYTTGMLVNFKPGTANTGASTLNIDTLGAKSIVANNTTGSALVANDLLTGMGQNYTLLYDGTSFRNINGPDGAWTGVSGLYVNSWTDFGSGYQVVQYRKLRDGTVQVRGAAKAGTETAGTTVFTLPAGYRPPTLIFQGVAIQLTGGVTFGTDEIDIQSTGAFVHQVSTGINASALVALNLTYSVY